MPEWDQRNSVETCDEANFAYLLPDAAAAVTVETEANDGVESMSGSLLQVSRPRRSRSLESSGKPLQAYDCLCAVVVSYFSIHDLVRISDRETKP